MSAWGIPRIQDKAVLLQIEPMVVTRSESVYDFITPHIMSRYEQLKIKEMVLPPKYYRAAIRSQ